MSQTTKSLLLNEEEYQNLYQKYQAYTVPVSSPYIAFQIKLNDCVITAYPSRKVVFQGSHANAYAKDYEKEEPKSNDKNRYPEAGSDEVGTGDYFGPVVVCASYVTKEDVPALQQLGVQDSKALTDERIRSIAPVLEEKIIHSTLVLLPEQYNRVHQSNSMNVIKAKMHNQAYVNLAKKVALPDFKIIDQFEEEGIYYHHLKGEKNIIQGIHFETKAENKYYCVAASSILARYTFLQAMDQMSDTYDFIFPKGAGSAVDQCGKEFVKKFGQAQLKYVAKLHFSNTNRIL